MNSKPTFDEMEQHIIFQDGVIRDLRSRLNTHLIAAAPEMLEALKQAQVFLRKLKAEYCPDPIPPNSDSGLDWDTQLAIHDAITRATGREKGA